MYTHITEGYTPEKKKNTLIEKNTWIPIFTATLFTIASMEAIYIFINGWIKKIWYMYIMGNYLIIKIKILPFAATWMDLD